MKINHLNLTVTSVKEAASFFETYFGLKTLGQPAHNAVFVAMKDEADFTLTLMQAKKIRKSFIPLPFISVF